MESKKTLKTAVVLLNMGGPNSLFEVKTFLQNMFNDPYILPIKSNFFIYSSFFLFSCSSSLIISFIPFDIIDAWL